MNRSQKLALLAIGMFLIAVTGLSWWLYPDWHSRPGGILATIAGVIVGVVAIVANIYSIMKKDKPTGPSQAIIGDQKIAVNIAAQTVQTDKIANTIIETQNIYPSPTLETIIPPFPLFTIGEPPVDFVGREEELAELEEKFKNGVSISGVTGGAGIGKTALARMLAKKLTENYPDARLEVNLKGIAQAPETALEPDEAMRRLISPFYPGQPLPNKLEELQALYKSTFREKRALLLLDNAKDAAQVRDLILPLPSATIVTSRSNIDIPEMDLRPYKLGLLPKKDARKLLRSLSSRLKKEKNEVLDEISNACGYLPLALRIVGILFQERKDWNVQYLLSRLDERTRLAALKHPENPSLDVEAALDLSYQNLDIEVKKLFRALGVFPAPFDKQAAAALWQCSEDDTDLALGALQYRNLVDYQEKSLEYTLHDLTRLYVFRELLDQVEEARECMERHAFYYLTVGNKLDDLFETGGKHIQESISSFVHIWPHLETAWKRMGGIDKGWPVSEHKQEWMSKFPLRMPNLMDIYLIPIKRIPILENSLTASRYLGDRRGEGNALGILGSTYAALGDAHKAIEFYEKALAIYQEIGDRKGEGASLGNLGGAYAALGGDARKAIEFYEKALAIDQEIGDRKGEGAELGNLGSAYTALGDARKAIEFHEKALVITQEIGDRKGEGADLGNLGRAYAALGKTSKALECHNQALVIARETRDRRGEAVRAWWMGETLVKIGEFEQAIELMKLGVDYEREIGHPDAEKDAQRLNEVIKKANEAKK
jgi:tetratricopeptide (TPR) repeat protein